MVNTALLIGLGVVCLIMTVLALIFGVIALANNKPSKFVWLAVFLTSLLGLIVCIFLVVRKMVETVEDIAKDAGQQIETYADGINQLGSSPVDKHEINISSPQIKILKSYLPAGTVNNEPETFYSYAGYKDYYRYPLRFPFSIHCQYTKDNGELYNEINVTRFDENDNGEIYSGLSGINKIAFDKNFLLVEQNVTSTRTDKVINHYFLFNFETEKKEEAPSLSELTQLAKRKGYTGPDTLMTLVQYHQLF